MIILEDIKACRGNTKGLLFIVCFRISCFFAKNKFLKIVGFPFRIVFKIFFEYVYGVEIKDTTKIGAGFNLFHGYGTVISTKTIIGKHVSVRHNTTIASNGFDGKGPRPVIGDYVQIGASCIILGDIHIGNNSIIAAGSVVIRNVPEYSVVAGNPAKVIKYIEH